MAKIFISYNRQSQPIAKALAEDIEALGNTVWFDQELSGGQVWWDQILAKVRDCDAFVFVLDSESINSIACKREYGYASDLGKPILPVLVSDGVSTNLLPKALKEIQFVDYRNQDRGAAFSLSRAVSTLPHPKPLPDPLPPSPETPMSYLGSLTDQVETTSPMSYERQSELVADLRRGLRDAGARSDARKLLERLRSRRDLFATIAEDIDELLGVAINTPRREPDLTFLPRTGNGPLGPEKPELPITEPTLTNTNHKRDHSKAKKGALVGAFLGLVYGIVLILLRSKLLEYPLLYSSLIYPIIAVAIAGSISGATLRRISAMIIGAVVLWIVGIVVIMSGGSPNFLQVAFSSANIYAPLGAILGARIRAADLNPM